MAFHPGTCDTELSAPFRRASPGARLGTPENPFPPDLAASQLLTMLEAVEEDHTGNLYCVYDGSVIPF